MSGPLTRAQVHDTAIAAAYEVESIGRVILRLAPELASGPIFDEELARCFGLRLRNLAGVLMQLAGHGDDAPAGDELKHCVIEVFGELPPDEEADE